MTPTEVTTAEQFHDFLAIARQGERVIYHRGFLAVDQALPLVRDVAKAARHASRLGQADLTQRRIAESVYEYMAIRR